MGDKADTRFLKTPDGLLEMKPIPLYHGRGKIDKANARDNLFDAADVFESVGLEFGLIYGTLLGAVREGDFIEWDEDIDIYIVDEKIDLLHKSLWLLRDLGFDLVRCDDSLYSIMRRNDYIDIYVFRREGRDRICGLHVIPDRFLKFDSVIEFKGRNFFVPDQHVRLLQRLYGRTWMQPKQNSPAQPYTATKRAAMAVQHHAPAFHALIKQVRSWVRRG